MLLSNLVTYSAPLLLLLALPLASSQGTADIPGCAQVCLPAVLGSGCRQVHHSAPFALVLPHSESNPSSHN